MYTVAKSLNFSCFLQFLLYALWPGSWIDCYICFLTMGSWLRDFPQSWTTRCRKNVHLYIQNSWLRSKRSVTSRVIRAPLVYLSKPRGRRCTKWNKLYYLKEKKIVLACYATSHGTKLDVFNILLSGCGWWSPQSNIACNGNNEVERV